MKRWHPACETLQGHTVPAVFTGAAAPQFNHVAADPQVGPHLGLLLPSRHPPSPPAPPPAPHLASRYKLTRGQCVSATLTG